MLPVAYIYGLLIPRCTLLNVVTYVISKPGFTRVTHAGRVLTLQVTMADEAAAQRACKDPNPIIDGRKANVNLAYLGAKPRLPVGDILCRC